MQTERPELGLFHMAELKILWDMPALVGFRRIL